MTKIPTILLIEDDNDQIFLYSTKFKLEGLNFLSATTGREGIEIARREQPDLILLDILLNEENGVEVLKQLKGDALTEKIPVVVFSNLDKEATVQEALQHGAVEYILKTSLEPKDLVAKIRTILAKSKS